MSVDNDQAAGLPEGKSAEETPVPKSNKAKPGPQPLAPGEPTSRIYSFVPESLLEKAQRRAGKRTMSEYVRGLIEADVKRAS